MNIKLQHTSLLIFAIFLVSILASCGYKSQDTIDKENRLDSLANTKSSLAFHSLVLGEKFNKRSLKELELKIEDPIYNSDSVSYTLKRANFDGKWDILDKVEIYTTNEDIIYKIKFSKSKNEDLSNIYFEKYDKNLAKIKEGTNDTYWTWDWKNQNLQIKLHNFQPERNEIIITYVDKDAQHIHNQEVNTERLKKEQNKKEDMINTKNNI